jgi:hypothetical protein
MTKEEAEKVENLRGVIMNCADDLRHSARSKVRQAVVAADIAVYLERVNAELSTLVQHQL